MGEEEHRELIGKWKDYPERVSALEGAYLAERLMGAFALVGPLEQVVKLVEDALKTSGQAEAMRRILELLSDRNKGARFCSELLLLCSQYKESEDGSGDPGR